MRILASAAVMGAMYPAAPAAEARTDPQWSLFSEDGPPPAVTHAMAYDSARGRVVLFGGYNDMSLLGNTWEWDGSEWTQPASSGPSPRWDHAMAYDAVRQRVVLFGGDDGLFNCDTWEWDGSEWTQRATTGPPPRAGHAMAYHSALGRVVLFGGLDSKFNILGDTWELPSMSAPPSCPGDANGDGEVSFADITGVLTFWGFNYSPGTGPGDANNDGAVNFADVTNVLTFWGVPCP